MTTPTAAEAQEFVDFAARYDQPADGRAFYSNEISNIALAFASSKGLGGDSQYVGSLAGTAFPSVTFQQPPANLFPEGQRKSDGFLSSPLGLAVTGLTLYFGGPAFLQGFEGLATAAAGEGLVGTGGILLSAGEVTTPGLIFATGAPAAGQALIGTGGQLLTAAEASTPGLIFSSSPEIAAGEALIGTGGQLLTAAEASTSGLIFSSSPAVQGFIGTGGQLLTAEELTTPGAVYSSGGVYPSSPSLLDTLRGAQTGKSLLDKLIDGATAIAGGALKSAGTSFLTHSILGTSGGGYPSYARTPLSPYVGAPAATSGFPVGGALLIGGAVVGAALLFKAIKK